MSDPYANYGWRCAEILGISENISDIGSDVLKKIENGIEKADNLFKDSNFNFTDDQWKNLYSSFAKMSLWDGVDDKKVKLARKEGYSVLNGIKTKATEFADSLSEYYKRNKKYSLTYNILNPPEDAFWKTGAVVLDKAGYHLSSDLLKLAASGSGNKYIAEEGSYASNLLKNDKGINDFVKSKIWEYGESKNNPNPTIPTVTHEIPLGNGDIGAALHNVKLDIKASREADGKWTAKVKARDDFDFTEFKNPFKQESFKEGFLWFANNLATIDSKLGMLDTVGVEITYTKKF